jgi:glucokinase
MAILALDLGGTKLAAAIFDGRGNIIQEKNIPLNGRKGKEVGDFILNTASDLLKAHQAKAVGISVPGIVNEKTGKVWAPNIPGWEDYPLKDEISRLTGNIPVAIEADRTCYILGEQWKGKAAGYHHAIFIAVGTGIGAGILVNGKVLKGAHGVGGAIGWLGMEKPYDEKFRERGFLETRASGYGIAKFAKENAEKRYGYNGILKNIPESEITSRHVLQAYEEGDPVGRDTLLQVIEYWGMVTANLISIFNPEIVLFGGGVFGPAVKFLSEIIEEAEKWAQPVSMKQVQIVSSELGLRAGLYGAGKIAFDLLDSLKPQSK